MNAEHKTTIIQVGIGTRVLNFLVDTAIIFAIAYLLFKAHRWYEYYYHIASFNFGWYFAAVICIYYTFFESIFARTPGKWMSYSKVINANGGKPGFAKALIRSIIRLTIIDLFFIPFLDKPLHDYLSRTDVVEV